jgi:hypothetical protein
MDYGATVKLSKGLDKFCKNTAILCFCRFQFFPFGWDLYPPYIDMLNFTLSPPLHYEFLVIMGDDAQT